MPFTEPTTYEELGFTIGFLVSIDDTDGRYCVIDYTMPPGFGGPALHRHPSHESLRVLEGQIGLHLDGVERTLGPGESAHIRAGEPHSFWNEGHGPARCIFVGEERLETMLREICESAKAGELRPETMPEVFGEIERRHGVEHLGPPPSQARMVS